METDGAAAGPAAASEAESVVTGGGFWTSLPGILTGCTALIAALSGLVTGLNHAGVLGGKQADAHVVPSPSPTRTPRPAPEPRANEDGDLRPFYVNSPGDGFSWVRKEATKDSAGVATLASGTRVNCNPTPVPDPDPDTGRNWHFCPDEGGYISARLLKPARAAR